MSSRNLRTRRQQQENAEDADLSLPVSRVTRRTAKTQEAEDADLSLPVPRATRSTAKIREAADAEEFPQLIRSPLLRSKGPRDVNSHGDNRDKKEKGKANLSDLSPREYRTQKTDSTDDEDSTGEVERRETHQYKHTRNRSPFGDHRSDISKNEDTTDEEAEEEEEEESFREDEMRESRLYKRENFHNKLSQSTQPGLTFQPNKAQFYEAARPRQAFQQNKSQFFDDTPPVRAFHPNKTTFSDDEEELKPINLKIPSQHDSQISSFIKMIPSVLAVLVAFGCALYVIYFIYSPVVGNSKVQILKDFQHNFKELQSMFPNQQEIMWKRSKKIFELHLNNSNMNQQPAILLLTAARDSVHTLQCLSNQLAKAYASSLNSSYTVIYGANDTYNDSNYAKLSIDNSLSSGFKVTSRAAVLHRLEMLPAGALLILYKYCDHENAAFKDVALVLTVLLEEDTISPEINLKELEEKVADFLKNKFTHSDHSNSHNMMDSDKFSGVWSRISHVVLPVFKETEKIEACGK
ncbi:torsin-1A-interacting protein 1 isoform X2 [Bombina bombina]|uniref:torsin-1A-interacting protein 1 isoform X2 n=1 Tax=Bombina bombina TaxID=8345 RepID=UPI00235A6AF2|nr:torsin-1A-interacting protein 1 isoform X2 [Bombina bombina]